jgi:hypothetical protein
VAGVVPAQQHQRAAGEADGDQFEQRHVDNFAFDSLHNFLLCQHHIGGFLIEKVDSYQFF